MHNGSEHYTRIWIDAAITDTSDIYCILHWYSIQSAIFILRYIQDTQNGGIPARDRGIITIARHVRHTQLLILIFTAPARPRGGYHWACLWGTPGKHPSNPLTTTKKTRQAPPRPLQQLPLYPRQQVPPLGEFLLYFFYYTLSFILKRNILCKV